MNLIFIILLIILQEDDHGVSDQHHWFPICHGKQTMVHVTIAKGFVSQAATQVRAKLTHAESLPCMSIIQV